MSFSVQKKIYNLQTKYVFLFYLYTSNIAAVSLFNTVIKINFLNT